LSRQGIKGSNLAEQIEPTSTMMEAYNPIARVR